MFTIGLRQWVGTTSMTMLPLSPGIAYGMHDQPHQLSGFMTVGVLRTVVCCVQMLDGHKNQTPACTKGFARAS